MFGLTACKPQDGSGEKDLKLAFLTNNAANFWSIARRGCDEGAKEAGHVSVDFRIPSSASAAEQQQILDDLLAKGVDGIAISAIDPANQVEVLNRVAEQALLITQDSDVSDSKRVSYLGTDNVAAGREAGKLLNQALPNGGKIMIFVGSMDAQNARERISGLKQAITGTAIEVIDVRTDDTDSVRAKNNVQDSLVKYPDVAGLVGIWNYNGPAILNAVREAGKAGKVKIVCFDEEEETLAGVASGDIEGTVVQQPFEFGRQAIVRMAKYLRGDKTAFPADGRLIIPTVNITKANVAEFTAKLKEQLGK